MDAERSKDQVAREKLLQAEKRVLEIDKTRAPAEVVIEVLAPIRRGCGEHQFMFLTSSHFELVTIPRPSASSAPTFWGWFTGHVCCGNKALLFGDAAFFYRSLPCDGTGGFRGRCREVGEEEARAANSMGKLLLCYAPLPGHRNDATQ
jgi:hypothetical protein